MLKIKIRSWKNLAMLLAVSGFAFTQLSGCFAIPVPAIPIEITLAGNSQIIAADFSGSSTTVTVGAFCDFFDADALDQLIRQNGGDLIADRVQVIGAEVQSVRVTASEGNFNTINSASITLQGTPNLAIGATSSAGGLGSNFSMTQESPVDLFSDVPEGQCGTTVITLNGSAPAEDVTFTTTATILVYTQVTLL